MGYSTLRMHRTFSDYSPSSFHGPDPDPENHEDVRPMIRTEYT
jgi:hypothetical protein